MASACDQDHDVPGTLAIGHALDEALPKSPNGLNQPGHLNQCGHLNLPRRLNLALNDGERLGEMSIMDFGDPERPVDLVFVHANGFNAATYRALLAPLSGTLRIWAPDLRGHGRTRLSTRTRDRWTWHDHRDDLVALLDALDGPPVALAGHSMGATASLLAAAERPDLVARLVLFDPVILPPNLVRLLALPVARRLPQHWNITRGALRRRERFGARDEALASWRGRGPFKGWSETTLADYVSDAFDDAPEGGVYLNCSPQWEASNYAAQGHDPWRALTRLAGPEAGRSMRILKAETGSTCSVAIRPRSLPGARVEVVPGAGHLFPMTLPDIARNALLDASVSGHRGRD